MSRRRGAFLLAALVGVVVAVLFTTASDRADADRLADPYASPALAVQRQVTVIIPNGPGSADDETLPGTVLAEDDTVGQTLTVYRRESETCIRWQGPQSTSVTCRPSSGKVTFQTAGRVRTANGPTGQAAAWGAVPATATTVVIRAADGTTERVHPVDGHSYEKNFYISDFDVETHPVSSVLAYDADGDVVGAWHSSAAGRQR